MARHRCPYCKRFFRPDPRAVMQTHCGGDLCRQAHNRKRLQHWRSLNPDHKERYAAQERAWAKAHPDYWKDRRGNNPEYAARDDRRRVEGRRRAKLSANETGRRRLLVEKLHALDRAEMSANETGLSRLIVALDDCLRLTAALVMSTNETGIGSAAGLGG